MTRLGDAIRRLAAQRADEEAQALDAQLSDALWQAQMNPEQVGRVVRLSRVNVGQGYEFPGRMFPDGRARLMVNPLQEVSPEALAELEAQDER